MELRTIWRVWAAGAVLLAVASCGGSTPISHRGQLQSALRRYADEQGVATRDALRGLARRDFPATHAAMLDLQRATGRFGAAVRSLELPAAALPDARALERANRVQADDVARAVAAPQLSGIVYAIGHTVKDGGRELSLALRLRQDLPR